MLPQLAYDRSMRSKDAFGRLHVEVCNIGKATVSPYLGREIPGYQQLGLHPDKVYNLYRDPQELARAVDTFDNLPLLIKHVPVTAAKPQGELVVGTIGSSGVFQHPYIQNSLSVWTQEGIDLIESREQEQLSPAYLYDPDMTPGISPEGLSYDGVMRNIVGNHVAIVGTGRQGPDVVVADSLPQELPPMRSKFLAQFLALFAPAATPEQVVALDAALAMDRFGLSEDEMRGARDAFAKKAGKACDAMSEAECEEAYKSAAADKANPNAPAAPERGAPKPGASDEQLAAAVAAARAEGVEEGKAAAAKLAQDAIDAATLATKLAQDAAESLRVAREDVTDVCGEVTCDTAAAVYKFALDHLKVELDGVPPEAYRSLFRVASTLPRGTMVQPVVARVAAATMFPALANVRKG